MKSTFTKIVGVWLALLATGSFSVFGLIPDDADGDGVPDSVDVCPAEDASSFDRDGDGCLDFARGARHIEYWGVADTLITYLIHELGAPGIADDSEFDAVQAAIGSWASLANTELQVAYGGTSAQAVADGLDGVNLVTFRDVTYAFGGSTLAVGLTTSFETDSLVNGRRYRKGEIFDADMVFNPNMIFKTGGAGPGSDVQSVAAHEAGHLFGISHTAIRSSTMSYVLPAGLAARSLETDDELVFLKAYGDSVALAESNRIEGSVVNGQTTDPVPGAIVFVTDAASGDSVACDFTLPDGSYSFPGLPDGSYYVQIYPLNGSSVISFMDAANVNRLVQDTAETIFVPEFFDASESNTDDPADRLALDLSGGDTEVAAFVTNIDDEAPAVVLAVPDGTGNVRIDAPFRLKFSEAVDIGTIQAAFSFKTAGNVGIGGNISVIRDDSVLVFTPQPPLDFSASYTLRVDTDLEDLFGNALAADFTLNVTTEAEPPVSISSLAPTKGVGGTVVVVNGNGFDVNPEPTVTFNGMEAEVSSAEAGRLVVRVPDDAETGAVIVTNADLTQSNAVTFTVLTQAEVARGYESGQVSLSGTPDAITVTPDGGYAYIASTAGADAIVVDPALPGYLTKTHILYPSGLVDIASSPDGRRMYAVSSGSDELVEIDSDPADGLLFNSVIASRDVLADPNGIVVDPSGDRAFISTDEAEVQVWDVHLGSDTYRQQIGVLPSPDGLSLRGEMAITPGGDRLLALTDSGEILFYDLVADTLTDRVSIGIDPRDVVIDPAGERAYVTHLNGDISVVSTGSNPFFVQAVATSGSLRGIAISPGASFLYATDRELDRDKILDLDQTHATFRTVVDAIELATNPIDVVLSPDGAYAFSALQGELVSDAKMVVTTIGIGPAVNSIYPTAGQPGTMVVITGEQLTNGVVDGYLGEFRIVDFNGAQGTIVSATPSEIVVVVPVGVTSGPVRVSRVTTTTPIVSQSSNAVFFQALVEPSAFNMRFGGQLETPPGGVCAAATPALAMRPQGDVLFTGCADGDIVTHDILAGSPGFHRLAHVPFAPFSSPIFDLAVTADGLFGFATAMGGTSIKSFIANPNHRFFGKAAAPISLDAIATGPCHVRTSPNNKHMLAWGDSTSTLYLFDTAGFGDAPGAVAPIDTILSGFPVLDIAFHASGKAAYLVGSGIATLDLDPSSATFLNVVYSNSLVGLPVSPMTSPISYSAFPSHDGTILYIHVADEAAPFARDVLIMDTTTPANGAVPDPTGCVNIGGTPTAWSIRPALRMAPRGHVGIMSNEAFGFTFYNPTCPSESFYIAEGFDENTAPHDFEFTPDGQRFYVASTFHDAVRMYDFSAADSLVLVSGNGQNGVVSTTLPAPLRAQVLGRRNPSDPLLPVSGVPVIFSADPGNGAFVAESGFLNPKIVSTDAQGFAEVDWRLGATVGVQGVLITAEGLTNSPISVTATTVADPETLPLSLAEVLPLDGTSGTSITTAVLATFSRAVDEVTIDNTSLFIESAADATKVPVAYGFTDGGRKVSMVPIQALDTSHQYNVVYEGTIQASGGGGALTNPGETDFTTQPPPPLELVAVNPPSALRGVEIVLSGSGFDPIPSNNTVLFNDVAATPTDGDVNDLHVFVPLDAVAGSVRVAAGPDTTDTLPFTVLVPNTSPIDEVISNVGTGTGTKGCAVTPDGALCYTVSTDGDVVIPVDVEGLAAMDPIPVGDQPVAIVMHASGDYLYVANFNSGSVSVIGTDPDDVLSFNQVVETIQVGVNPIDLAIGGPSDLLYVANAGSPSTENVSIVDIDAGHAETFNEVISNVGTGTGAKGVAVSPDGTRLYVGTDTGFVIIGTDLGDLDTYHTVISNVGTGTGTKGLAVSPDGTLLFIVGTNGSILIVDVSPGSSNQVISNVGTGTGAKGVAVSPDGTLLYIIQENSSEVLVIAINVIPGVGAINPDAASSFQVETSLVHAVTVGADPGDVAIDPSGSGVVFVTNTGDKTLSILNGSNVPLGDVPAEVIVTPSTLNLTSHGRYVTGSVELAGFFVEEIVVSSVRLQQVIPAVPGLETIDDADNDGIQELVMKFDRAQFQAILPQGEYAPVSITGDVRNRTFAGEDTIRTLRPNVTHPRGGSHFMPGSATTIQWTTPSGYGGQITAADVHFSGDNGVTWTPLADHVPNSGSLDWTTPVDAYLPQCRVMITLWKNDEIFGQGMSQDPFAVTAPVAVRLKSFEAGVEDGDAVLRWETNFEVGMSGFQVVRADEERGTYANVTKELIAAQGDVTGARYEYRDAGIRPNRSYWYKLVEVTTDGPGAEFGPYSVYFKLNNALEQNVPNPFNPATTIKYSIAADVDVKLAVYDVAGRRVRKLVDGRQRADVYKVTWDGVNDDGQRVASGVYFYKLVAGKFVQTKKMMLLK
jgi:DNA-binding beta-propeller fold protein YncE